MKQDSRFEKLDAVMGRLMLAGVLTSAACLSIGLVLFLLGREGPSLGAILTSGLFVLMATPMLRVAVAVIESVRMRDWSFVATTLAVVILIGLTLAHAAGIF